MKTETEKEKKKEEEILSREKQLKKDIERIQKDLVNGLKMIKLLKEEREEKIEIVKQVAAENKLNYDMIVTELEKMLNRYKILEIEMEEVQNELKLLLEGSYKELLETQKEKAELMERHKCNTLLKTVDAFTEAQFSNFEGDVDIAPLLKKLSNTMYRKKD